MLTKLATFESHLPNGDPAIRLFRQGSSITKVAGDFMPEIQDWLSGYKTDVRQIAVLVNAMGGSEYWGQNCLPAGTPILLADGNEIPVEEIKVGDEVVSHTGSSRRVSRLFRHEAQGLFGIRPQGQSKALWTTGGHPYWAVTRSEALSLKRKFVYSRDSEVSLKEAQKLFAKNLNPEWIPASDLSKGDLVFLRFETEVEVHEELNREEMAYVLGWYAAKGTIGRRRRKDRKGQPWQDHMVVFTLGGHESHIADRLEEIFRSWNLSPARTDNCQGAHAIRIVVYSPKLARICRDHVGKGSTTKKLSPDVMRMPLGWQEVFLENYLEGDGCVRPASQKGAGSVRGSTSSIELAGDIRMMLARTGRVASIIPCRQHHTSLGAGNPIYEISVPASQFDEDLASQTESFLHPDGYLVCPIKSVEEVEDWAGSVYNFEVEVDNSYVADRVVVHNSNGDYFAWSALAHDCSKPCVAKHPIDDFTGKQIPPYGYRTFLEAHPFAHHVNKDPERAFGSVALSCLNHKMKRVELVVLIDREKALKFGGQHALERIDAGEFPDTSMGCFRAGTPILMSDGTTKAIEDVKEGDKVFTHLGKSRTVIDTMVRDHERIFRFKAYGHEEQWVTEEHPLWLARKSDLACRPSSPSINNGRKQGVCTTVSRPEFNWVSVAEAQEGDYVAAPVPRFPAPERILSRAEARLVGYYLAEGHLLRSKAGNLRGVQFSTGLEESRNHSDIYEMAIELGLEENISDYDVEERNGKYISIWGAPELASLCEKLCGSGDREKVLHPELLGQPREILLEVLGAYTNGDGGTYKGAVYFSTCSEKLAHQLGLAAMLCGLIPSYSTIVHKPNKLIQKETVEHQVWIGTDTSWKLDTTWKPTRKSKRANNKRFFYENGDTTWLLTTIEALEKHETEESVYNFSVEGHESYIAGGLAVHNCRVPYDVCRICGHKSRTSKDYCVHVRELGMGIILDDGRQVGVLNPHPRFFDISFVFRGADRTAKTMAKLASSDLWVPQSVKDAFEIYGADQWEGLMKAASDYENSVPAVERLPGGKGDKFKVEDFDPVQLVKGIQVELEHTGDRGLAIEIAMDHLAELPDYYDRLEKMEKAAKIINVTDEARKLMPGPAKFPSKKEQVNAIEEDGGEANRDLKIEAAKEEYGQKIEDNAPGGMTDGLIRTNVDDFPMGQAGTEKHADYKKPPHREERPFVGQRKWRGMTINVETPAGGWRRGENWASKMKYDYGEIEGSLGTDGDAVDVYVGPHENSENVYIVHQNHVMGPKKGQYDEDKVMLGFRNSSEAKKAYLAHYDRQEFFRSITEMPLPAFKKMIFRKDSKGEKIAQHMEKVASMELEDLFIKGKTAQKRSRAWSSDGKTATHVGPGIVKQAATKEAEIDKLIQPDGIVGLVTKVLDSQERRLPDDILDSMAQEDVSKALATPSAMGMILRPSEFQMIILKALGHGDAADDFASRGVVFGTNTSTDGFGSLNPIKDVNFKLIEKLLPFLEQRSYLRPVLARRVVSLRTALPQLQQEKVEENPLLSKVAAAYTWYRSQMVKVASDGAYPAMDRCPQLKAAVYGLTEEGIFFQKEANAELARVAVTAASVPLVLMLASSARRDLERGEDVGFLRRLLADHPYLASLGGAALARSIMKDKVVNQAVRDVARKATRLVAGA